MIERYKYPCSTEECEHVHTTPAFYSAEDKAFVMWCEDCGTEFSLWGRQIDDAFLRL